MVYWRMLSNKELTSIIHTLFKNIKEKFSFPNSFYEASTLSIPNIKRAQKEKTTDQYFSYIQTQKFSKNFQEIKSNNV